MQFIKKKVILFFLGSVYVTKNVELRRKDDGS